MLVLSRRERIKSKIKNWEEYYLDNSETTTMKMRKKWTIAETAVRLSLFAILFAQHGPTASSVVHDEHESVSVVGNVFAAYSEQPCCVHTRHVRHHKSELSINIIMIIVIKLYKRHIM